MDDWIDYDENKTIIDGRLIEMGWMFRNTSSLSYDGFKTKFIYNYTAINDPFEVGYSRHFIIEDLYTRRLNITNEPLSLTLD